MTSRKIHLYYFRILGQLKQGLGVGTVEMGLQSSMFTPESTCDGMGSVVQDLKLWTMKKIMLVPVLSTWSWARIHEAEFITQQWQEFGRLEVDTCYQRFERAP